MRSFSAPLSLYFILLTILTGSSTTMAQGTLSTPEIVRPKWTSAQIGFDSGWVGNFQVTIRKTGTATRFKLCLWPDPPQVAYACRTFNQSEGVMQGSDIIRFVVQIPAAQQGRINELSVSACNNSDQCGSGARERFLVLPTAPTLFGPPHPSPIPANRSVRFSWQHLTINIPGAASSFPGDYQLTILTASPEDIGWTTFNPEAVSSPNVSSRLNTGSTCPFTPGQSNLNSKCHTLTLPAGPTSFIWTIANCATFPEKGRRCGPSSFRSLTTSAPATVTFSASLAPTFRHARCVNCHAVVPDSFQNDSANNPPGGLPSNHPGVNANTNCSTCHTNNLLPAQGTVNPGWHGPAGMDFRNRNDQQLCLSAHFGVGGQGTTQAVLDHLTQDKLILWAIGDGRVPGGGTRPLAPPGNIASWQATVQAWVNAGMPCS